MSSPSDDPSGSPGISPDHSSRRRHQNEQIDIVTALRSPAVLPRRSQSDRLPPPQSSAVSGYDHDLPPLPQMSPEARRQSMMAIDRKRRLTASAHESSRRRTTAGDFMDRSRQSIYPGFVRRSSGSQERERSSQPEVIDLTSSSPPQNTSSARTRPAPSASSSSRYLVPRWQPDEETSECPICHRPFSFLFRRHHCRKCGRVVCNDCSPHRITIPRQYIVHPPGYEPQFDWNTSAADFVRDDEERNDGTLNPPRGMNPALGGGEKVRLCNPCVPDPQPEHQTPQSSVLTAFGPSLSPLPQDQPSYRPLLSQPPNSASSERRTSDYYRSASTRTLHPPTENNESEYDSLPEPFRSHLRSQYQRSYNSQQSSGGGLGHARFHSLNNPHPLVRPPPPNFRPLNHSDNFAHILNAPPRSAAEQIAAASRAGYPLPPSTQVQPRILPQPPRRRLREEDICPICHRELPAKGEDNDETEREEHIMNCITTHSTATTSSTPRPDHLRTDSTQSHDQASSSLSSRPVLPSSPLSTPTPPISSTSLPGSTSRPLPIPQPVPGPGPAPTAIASSSSQSSRPPTMLPFTASEKDCLPSSDGTPPECSICMVEYEPGERLIRLDCWCKFHEMCIVEWVGRGGGCPLHKISG